MSDPATAARRHIETERSSGHSQVMLAGVLLGLGLGGFVDGIVLHQILQWHPARVRADLRWNDRGPWITEELQVVHENGRWLIDSQEAVD